MAFKYLYCCDGADKSKFSDCDMPLDQYTLAWLFCEQGIEKCILFQGWSWFTEEKYYEVANTIKEILGSDILGKELVIWETFRHRVVDIKMNSHA